MSPVHLFQEEGEDDEKGAALGNGYICNKARFTCTFRSIFFSLNILGYNMNQGDTTVKSPYCCNKHQGYKSKLRSRKGPTKIGGKSTLGGLPFTLAISGLQPQAPAGQG